MNRIIKIAKDWQQERANAELQWASVNKIQKTKNKMLARQLDQFQAMNGSLERENERLWKMVNCLNNNQQPQPIQTPAPVVTKSKKRTYVEIVDLTKKSDSDAEDDDDDDEPNIFYVKKEVVVKEEQQENNEIFKTVVKEEASIDSA